MSKTTAGGKARAITAQGASIGRAAAASEQAEATGRYVATCIGADGKVKWQDEFSNLVTTVGKNDALDKYLSGSAYTAAWYLGLIGATGYSAINAADTAASHAGWTESNAYTQASRPTASFAAASAGSKALSAPAVFSINAIVTIKGAFLITNATKGGTTGILYSAGLFTGGDRALVDGDTLNVSYVASL